ncbi:putative ribonuclease H-like domain-containing protein [Tanacetum coccineum]
MTGNISYLFEYEPFNEGCVSLSFGHGRGKITGKGSIKTSKLKFENVYFVEELKFNLFSVSQICDNKNSILFTATECLVLGKDFKLVDDKHVLLRTPRQQNMYTIDLKNIVPHKNLTCLIAKALVDECMLWHRSFEKDHSCVACLKGKQHKPSCKTKLVNSVSLPLHTLHMDLFGPTSVSSLNHKWYCLIVTDDFSRFTWTFFLQSKDETSRILRNFITEIENLKDLKLKIIRCDNGGEFRNREMDEFCSRKCIKREFSNARTPQQNGVAERRNWTLIEAARTMLADSKLPVTFWAEVVNTACYVQNRFDAKADEGYFVGYSLNSKAFRVFNKSTKKVEENLHVDFLENRSIEKGTGKKKDVHQAVKKKESLLTFIALPNWFHEAQMETSNDSSRKSDAIPVNVDPQNEQEGINGHKAVSKRCRNMDPTAIEPELTSTVETEVPTISTPTPTGSLFVPPVTSSVPRIILRGGPCYSELPSLGNAMSFENRLEDLFGDTNDAVSLDEMEADLSNMGTAIQEEGINYEEVFAPVARIKAIRLFLAYASYMGFTVYQMDVKSAFLYGTIDEEVYVMQPPGFQDLEFPDRVYKVEKAIGTIDQTLFIKKYKGEFLLVQVYVDDIIFGSSNPKLCREFKSLMHDKFQMSAMGELNFFLGLQVLQKKDGIFISQDKYVGDILKKLGFTDIRLAKTPMDRENPWGKDGTGKDVELHLYRSLIESLMYLTTSRSGIMFAVCACARYQVTPKECHLHAVKRIFMYLKGHPKLGLWYSKESPFDLVAYSDSDYCCANQDRKSTTRGCQFLGRRLISWECKKQTIVATSTTEVEYVAAASGYGQVLWIQN